MLSIASLQIELDSRRAKEAKKAMDEFSQSTDNATRAVKALSSSNQEALIRYRQLGDAASERQQALQAEAQAHATVAAAEQSAAKAMGHREGALVQSFQQGMLNAALYTDALLALNSQSQQLDVQKIQQFAQAMGQAVTVAQKLGDSQGSERSGSWWDSLSKAVEFAQTLGTLRELGKSTGLTATLSSTLGTTFGATLAGATGGVAALGTAYYQGMREAEQFNLALVSSGNYAGVTSSQLGAMADRVGGVVGNIHAAADALTLLAGSGMRSSENFEAISEAAISMSEVTGRSVRDIVKEFVEIGKDPVGAVVSLNEKYGVLTGAVYDQVSSLMEQGKYQDAVLLVEKEYAREMGVNAIEIRKNLGVIERSWLSLKKSVESTWDAIRNPGREENIGDIDKGIVESGNIVAGMMAEEKVVETGGGAAIFYRKQKSQAAKDKHLSDKIDLLRKQDKEDRKKENEELKAYIKIINDDGVKARDIGDRILRESYSPEKRAELDIIDLNRNVLEPARLYGNAYSEEEEALMKKEIRRRYGLDRPKNLGEGYSSSWSRFVRDDIGSGVGLRRPVNGQRAESVDEDEKKWGVLAGLSISESLFDEKNITKNWWEELGDGLLSYSQSTEDVFERINKTVTGVFDSMGHSLSKFVMTGKLEFKGLADSIIENLVQIAIQQSIVAPLAGLFGGLLGGGAANPLGVNLAGATWGPLLPLSSGGYTGDGGRYEPAGIVHRGEGVLNQDEIRAIGGEAGFNALRRAIRGPRHSMGGMAGAPALPPAISGGAGQAPVQVNIEINGSDQQVQTQSPDGLESFAKLMGEIARSEYQKLQLRSYQGGGMAWQAQQGAFR